VVRHEPAYALLIADDIKLQADRHVDMQIMLDVSADWAQINGMEWGLRKCGVIGLADDDPPLYLGQSVIPRVQEYKYLGIPFVARSYGAAIDLAGFATRLAAKGRAALNFMRAISFPIAEGIKSEMWRMFGRSRSEYGAALVWIWLQRLNRGNSIRQAVETLFADLDKDAIAWITGSGFNLVCLQAMFNLPPTQWRWEELSLSLAMHIERLVVHNPFRKMIAAAGRWSIQHEPATRQLHQRLDEGRLEILREWKEAKAVNQLLTRKTFLRRRRFHRWRTQTTAKTACMISQSARRFAGMDSVVLIGDRDQRWNAIRWRTNRHYTTTRCANRSCSRYVHGAVAHPFVRACLHNQEFVLMGLLDRFNEELAPDELDQFKRPDEVLRSIPSSRDEEPRMPEDARNGYSLLDHLLNKREHARFAFIWTHLTRPNMGVVQELMGAADGAAVT
jgi:hypothetical protein